MRRPTLGLPASSDELDFVLSYGAENASERFFFYRSFAVGTEINLALFLPGFVAILLTISVCLP